MVLVCVLISVLLMLSPISVCAYEVVVADPVEPAPTFYGYKILGYDEDGNTEISNDDYMQYLNQQISVRSEIMTMNSDLLDRLVDTTMFIPGLQWVPFAYSAAKACLENPVHAGEKNTFNEVVSSVGKKRILYSKADFYEWITLYFDTDLQTETNVKVRRSALGVTTTFEATMVEGTKMSLSYGAGEYCVTGTYSILGGGVTSSNTRLYMKGMTVNNLPQSVDTGSSAVPNTSMHIWGGTSGSSSNSNGYGVYAENTYYTNSYEKRVSHDVAISSDKYFLTCVIMSPILFNTQIDQTNIANYFDMGYTWNNMTNSIDVDPDILLAWLEANLIPQLQLQYEKVYQNFPEPDATFGDTYETLLPFETDAPDTLPPATLPPGSGGGDFNFDFNYDEVISPSELQDLLEQETYYLAELDTLQPDLHLNSIPKLQELPEMVVTGVSGLGTIYEQLLSVSGVLSVFGVVSVVVFFIRVFKG